MTELKRAREMLSRIMHSPHGGTLLPGQAGTLNSYMAELEEQVAQERILADEKDREIVRLNRRIGTLSAKYGTAEIAR